jgi:invasion protein IalB
MLARILAVTLVLFAVTTAAEAQPRALPLPPAGRGFPPEKFSAQPVQPQMNEAPARLSPAANPRRWPVVESAWTKFCGKDKNDPHGKLICFTVKEVRLRASAESGGSFVAGVALIETADDDKKILRVTLPPDLQRSTPARLRVDEDGARSGEFGECLSNGCFWDFPVDAEFVARLKTGDRLHVEGVAATGEVASYDLPLGEFTRANEGPPTDPTRFKDEQKRRWEERSRVPSMPQR